MKKIFFLLVVQSIMLPGFSQVIVKSLLCENLVNPIGIDATQPRFTWQLSKDKRNVMQTAYELKVSANKETVWSSGKVSSGQSVQITYGGKPLQSGKKYNWQVRVWDNKGKCF